MAERLSMTEYAERETFFGIVPILKEDRIYSMLDLALVSGSFAIATWCYVQGASLAGVMTLPQAVANLFGAIMLVMPLVCLVGIMANKYGVDHWLCARAVFGFVGVYALLLCAMAASQGFMALNAIIFGGSISSLLDQAGWSGATDPWVVKAMAAACPIIGYLIAFRGVQAVRVSGRIMGIALLAVGVVVLVAVLASGEARNAWNAEPLYGMPASRDGYMLGAEWNIAFVFAWFIGIGAMTRVTKTERASNWGLYLGYGVFMCIYILLGVVVAFVATAKGAPPVADPTTYLLEVGGPALGSLALILVAVANISTAAVSVFINTLATKILWPSWRYEWVGAFYTVVIVVLILWGGLLDNYGTFLALVGVINAPALTLLVVDYWIVRRRRLSLSSLFSNERGSYRYTGGVNVVAWIAFACGAVSYFLVYDPINYVPRIPGVFNVVTATGLAAIVSAVVYLVLAAIPPVRRYLLRDKEQGADCAC